MTDSFFGFPDMPLAKFRKKKILLSVLSKYLLKKKKGEIWDQWQKMGLRDEPP